jgi:lactoylglutathione lyase
MTLDHIAIWTNNLEGLRDFYIKYFGGKSGGKYSNDIKHFQSYFVTFEAGARLEIMTRPDIRTGKNEDLTRHYKGITHLAFAVHTMDEVKEKARVLAADGFKILDGPRKTGDGCYEFVVLDPDGNKVEITTLYTGE